MPDLFDGRLPIRFWSKVRLSPDGCWIWKGSRNPKGYGLYAGDDGKRRAAHRAAYSGLVLPLPPYRPDGDQLDHLCRNRACVNPDHLELVSPRVNTLRGRTVAARRVAQTQCVNGHAFTPENTRIRPDGCRDCRECHRRHSRESARRRRGEAA